MSSTAGARGYHHGDLRAELLRTAGRLLADEGPGALTVRELARRAGVSHGAPARHFADRRALLDALAVEGFAALTADLRAAAGSADRLTWRERLTALAGAYTGYAVANPALLAHMYAAKADPAAGPELLEAGRRSLEPLLDVVLDAQRAGAVRPGDAAEQAGVAFAAVHGVAMLAVGDLLDGRPLEGLLSAALDVLLRGLAADAAPRAPG